MSIITKYFVPCVINIRITLLLSPILWLKEIETHPGPKGIHSFTPIVFIGQTTGHEEVSRYSLGGCSLRPSLDQGPGIGTTLQTTEDETAAWTWLLRMAGEHIEKTRDRVNIVCYSQS